jgi:hypothetical protein
MAKIDAEFKKYPFKFIGERLKQERLRLGYTAKSVYERLPNPRMPIMKKVVVISQQVFYLNFG